MKWTWRAPLYLLLGVALGLWREWSNQPWLIIGLLTALCVCELFISSRE